MPVKVTKVRKAPIITDWTNTASTELRIIAEWEKKYPDAGIGVLAGAGDYPIYCLDIDSNAAGTHKDDGLGNWHRLVDKHELVIPPTRSALTPSGGRHLLFWDDPADPLPNAAGVLANGVDH